EQRSEILPDIELRILAADQQRDLTGAPGRRSRIDLRCACLQDVARAGLILVRFREYGGGGHRLNAIPGLLGCPITGSRPIAFRRPSPPVVDLGSNFCPLALVRYDRGGLDLYGLAAAFGRFALGSIVGSG